MTEVINIQHWLDDDGIPVPALRRQVLRVARLIESGGPLRVRESRETLVECSRRVRRKPCEGLLWVTKLDDETIEACCPICLRERLLVRGWEPTEWATGPMVPIDLKTPLREPEVDRSLTN